VGVFENRACPQPSNNREHHDNRVKIRLLYHFVDEMCKNISFSAQLLAKAPGHRPRYFNRYNGILDIRQHVDLISVQNPCWLMKKYRVKNYPNLSNINCELSGSSMGFPFKKTIFWVEKTL
jgi:hypothetical protein